MKGSLLLACGKRINTLYLRSGSSDVQKNLELRESRFDCVK